MNPFTIPLLLLLAPAAGAQSDDARSDRSASSTVDALIDCRKIAANADRLACFDRVAAAIAGVRTSGALLVLDRRDVVQRKRRRFGLANPEGDVFGGGEADRQTEVRELASTIAVVRPSSYGRFALQLADNSVWETIEPLPFPPRTGTAITVKRAALGGFRASVGGGRSVLVKRQR